MNHTAIRLCAALLLIGLGLFWHKPAEAAVSCSGGNVSVSGINFGAINPLSGNVDITGTLSGYSCTNTGNASNNGNSPQTFAICFNLLGQDSDPRVMTDGQGNSLQYQLFTDSTYITPWGNQTFGMPLTTMFTVPSDSLPHTGPPITIHGRVLGGQTSAQPTSYNDFFGAGQVSFTYTTHNGTATPESCQGAGTLVTTPASFTVKASVTALCSINATPLDFGTPAGVLNTAVTSQTDISVQCASTVAYNVGLDGGLHSGNNINARAMALGANSVAYQLYRDSGRTQVWGNTVGTDTVAQTGDGTWQDFTVYGRVPAQTTPPAGTYQDTVVVSVTY